MKKSKVKLIAFLGIGSAFLLLLFFILIITITIAIVGSAEKLKEESSPVEGLPGIITQEMLIGAVTNKEKYGVPASITLAQIILESSGNYRGSKMSQLAYEGKNLFGIKGQGPAGSISLSTKEYRENGSGYGILGVFRKYNSYAESIEDHGKLLSSQFYREYTKNIDTTDDYARAIAKAGYATDPKYADQIINVIRTYNLYRFDNMSLDGIKNISKDEAKATGSLGWPLAVKGIITCGFGPRKAPVPGASTFHQGVDIAGPSGTSILATDGGTVILAGQYGGGGMAVRIDHGGGIITEYLHLRAGDGIMVTAGQIVTKGQQIGKMGTTGISSGTHLHFGVSVNGTFVDPLNYIKQP